MAFSRPLALHTARQRDEPVGSRMPANGFIHRIQPAFGGDLNQPTVQRAWGQRSLERVGMNQRCANPAGVAKGLGTHHQIGKRNGVPSDQVRHRRGRVIPSIEQTVDALANQPHVAAGVEAANGTHGLTPHRRARPEN